jgi:hypothetical protein
MSKKLLFILLLISSIPFTLSSQELTLSTSAKTYADGEQVWVNLSVLNAASMPGAYKIGVAFDASKLAYLNTLPAENGPFSITPAVSASNGTVTVAGFQGIVDTGNGSASLVTLLFTAANDNVTIDTTSFSVSSEDVFSTEAQKMELIVSRQAASVLLPPSQRTVQNRIYLTNNYLRFSVPHEGVTSIRIFDLGGRTVAVPLAPTRLKAGNHCVSLDASLGSGVYLVALRGVGLKTTKKLEVIK